MKKLEFNSGGRPLINSDLSYLQDFPLELAKFLSRGSTGTRDAVLSGLEFDFGTGVVSGGVVLMDGDLRTFGEYTGATAGQTLHLQPLSDETLETRLHEQSGSQPVAVNKRAEIRNTAQSGVTTITFVVGDDTDIPRLITGHNIQHNTITGGKLVNQTITESKMANNSVSSRMYQDGSIQNVHIGNGQIATDKLQGKGFKSDWEQVIDTYNLTPTTDLVYACVGIDGFVRLRGYAQYVIPGGWSNRGLGTVKAKFAGIDLGVGAAEDQRFPMVAINNDDGTILHGYLDLLNGDTIIAKFGDGGANLPSGTWNFHFDGIMYESSQYKLTTT